MPHGIQIISEHGTTQIDENYTNLALVDSGDLWVPANNNGLPHAQLARTGSHQLLCIRPHTASAAVAVLGNGSYPTTTWDFYTNSSTVLTWYLFSVPNSDPGGMGLRVYRPDGAVAYNSAWKVLRIGNLVKIPDSGDPYSVPHTGLWQPYGATWAACLTGARRWFDGDLGNIMVDGMYRRDDGLWHTDFVTTGSMGQGSGAGPEVWQAIGGTILLVDVSGY